MRGAKQQGGNLDRPKSAVTMTCIALISTATCESKEFPSASEFTRWGAALFRLSSKADPTYTVPMRQHSSSQICRPATKMIKAWRCRCDGPGCPHTHRLHRASPPIALGHLSEPPCARPLRYPQLDTIRTRVPLTSSIRRTVLYPVYSAATQHSITVGVWYNGTNMPVCLHYSSRLVSSPPEEVRCVSV
jgi:hypothetical protein